MTVDATPTDASRCTLSPGHRVTLSAVSRPRRSAPNPQSPIPNPRRSLTFDVLTHRLLVRLAKILRSDLTPEQLARLITAFANSHSAHARAMVQRVAARRQAWDLQQQYRTLKKEKAKANKPRKSMAQHMHDVFGVVPRFKEKKYEDYINSVDALGRPL